MSDPVFPGGIDLVPGPQGPPLPANALRLVTIGGALYSTTDGITFTAVGGGGSGTIHTSAPLSGDGSVGTPATIAAGAIALTKLSTQAANTLVGNGTGSTASPTALTAAQALSALGISSGNWKSQMFAFAKSQYSTIGRDILTDFSLGPSGDYTGVISNPNGGVTPAVNYASSWPGGGVELDTGASTATSTSIYITRKGNPTLTSNIITGAPWFVASRARTNLAPSATSLIHMIAMTGSGGPFAAASPALGIHGATSTTNWSLYNAATWTDTGVALPTLGTFADLAIGFDGSTLTYYVGSVFSGTMTAVGTSTTLGSLQNSPGQPGAIVFTSDTTRMSVDVASLYGACANP